jgi:SAM-dependent methyltransferase
MKRHSNSWQLGMYNTAFARTTIGSKAMRQLAEKQVSFLEFALDLEPGARILDVPCGTGRHSVLFAHKGYQVTGIDISRDCLALAKRQAAHRNVRYRHGDMADLSTYRGQFDAVLNLFTSFGYFATDRENEAVLQQMKRALRPGGRLVLNLLDRDFVLPIYNPARWHQEGSVLSIETSKYDPKTKYNESHWTILETKGAKKPKLLHHHYHRIRLYSRSEILRMLKKAGFRRIQVFGDFDGHPYRKGKSTHPIYIASAD